MLELKKLYFTIQDDDVDNGDQRNIIDGIDFTWPSWWASDLPMIRQSIGLFKASWNKFSNSPLYMINTISKSKMILRRLGGGDEAYCTRVTFRLYVEEADNDANKNSALI
jgi:hypothetical protein